MLPTISGEFRAVADSSLKFAPSGVAVAQIRAAANSRKKNDQGEWVDDKAVFVTVVAFKKLAENVAESITKGTLFEVSGRMEIDEWETKDGEKRTTVKIMADRVAVSLAFDPAQVVKGERSSGSGRASAKPEDDPWAGPQDDSPPF